MIALDVLVPGGSFICKIFQGGDFDRFMAQVKNEFKTCKIYKPKSTRKASKEIYVIGLSKKIKEHETCQEGTGGNHVGS